jgi:hypothetical protein
MNGTWAIEPRYNGASSFLDDIAIVAAGDTGPVGVIDKTGSYLVPPVFKDLRHSGAHGNAILARKDRKWGLVDYQGRWIRRPQYDDVREWSERYVAVSYYGKWGVIDVEGNWAIEPRYDGACAISEGLAVVRDGDKWGILDDQGRWKVEPQFSTDKEHDEDTQRLSSEGLINMKIGDKWGYVDANGTTRIAPEYELTRPFVEGRALAGVLKDDVFVWTFIRQDGTRITDEALRIAGDFDGGIAPAMVNDMFGAIGKEGEWVIPPKYSKIIVTEGPFCAARIQGRWGAFDKQGKLIVPFEYDRFGVMSGDGVCLIKDGIATWWLRKGSEIVTVTLDEKERERIDIPQIPEEVTTQPADR